jgi:YVTN family beta-propeller protein
MSICLNPKYGLVAALLAGVFVFGACTAPFNAVSVPSTSPAQPGIAENLTLEPLKTTIEGTIWVANEEANSLTVINAATNTVITTLSGIEGPHNVQISPDGQAAWAVSGHQRLVIAVDVQSLELRGWAPVGSSPAHVVVSPDGATAYVTNSGDNTVTAIDTATFAIRTTIPVGDFPHGLRVSNDGRLIAVANMRGGSVSLIDAVSLTVSATVEVGAGPVQVAFTPGGETLYVTLNGEDAVVAVSIATQAVVGKAAVGDGPVQVYVTPDESLVLVANQGSEDLPGTTLSFVDAVKLAELDTVETGQGAHGVVVEPSGRYAYVTNLYNDNLSVVDLVARQVETTVPTGISPNGVSFSPLTPTGDVKTEIVIPPIIREQDLQGQELEEHDAHH